MHGLQLCTQAVNFSTKPTGVPNPKYHARRRTLYHTHGLWVAYVTSANSSLVLGGCYKSDSASSKRMSVKARCARNVRSVPLNLKVYYLLRLDAMHAPGAHVCNAISNLANGRKV